MYEVHLSGLEVYAYHGVPDEEQAIGHRYRMDLAMTIDGDSDETDDVMGTVDYGLAGRLAAETLRGTQCRTIERAATLICEALLDRFPLVRRVVCRLEKRLPPADLMADSAGVVLVRSRDRED